MRKYEPSPGDRFGSWTIVCELPNDRNGNRKYLCRCDCGSIRGVYLQHLVSKHKQNTSTMCRACAKEAQSLTMKLKSQGIL